MSRSQIFEEFVKVAQENGVITLKPSDASFKKLEKNPRADSLDISAISALYGVKPDVSDDMSYKNNIMESAHKESVIVSPAYDALNGLVENNIERQNIMLRLVNRNPDGLLTQRKYAEAQLTMALVRIAEQMDDLNRENLRKLADSCLINADAEFKKEAFEKRGWYYTVAAVVVALTALYAQQHLPFVNEGFLRNHEKLVAELQDLSETSKGWGVGYDLDPSFKNNVITPFIDTLNKFKELFDENFSILENATRPRTIDQLKELANSPENNKNAEAYKALKEAADQMRPYIESVRDNFKSETYKAMQIRDRGWAQSLIDKTQFLHGGAGFVADMFDDVVRALNPYISSVDEMLEMFRKAETFKEEAKRKLERALANQSSSTPSATSGSTTTNVPTPPTFAKK